MKRSVVQWVGLQQAVVLSILLMLLACSVVNNKSRVTLVDEFEYNHYLLEIFYSWPEEVPSLTEAEGRANPAYGAYAEIYALYESLTDPYTTYYNPEEAEAVLAYFTESGSSALVGISVDSLPTSGDTLYVVRVVPGSPAEELGIRRLDTLLTINGVSAVGPTAFEVFRVQTAGDAGKVVEFDILRNGQVLSFTVIKRDVILPTVYVDTVEQIPVIQITQFVESSINDGGTAKEFEDILRRTSTQREIIVDVRGNPGGSVDECVQVSDHLVESGILIRSIERTHSERQGAYTDTVQSTAQRGGPGEGRYVVVMGDRGSASCAEILISALQRNLGSPLVGDTTFGKGIGQRLLFTVMEGLAKITSLEFRDDRWETYHGVGLIPDYYESDPAQALARAVSLAKSRGAPEDTIEGTSVALARRASVATELRELALRKQGRVVEGVGLPGAYKLTEGPERP